MLDEQNELRDSTLEGYRLRIERVMAHIERSLDSGDQDLSLDALAEVGCFSRFHFHRIFRAMTGETPAQTVRRLRLHRAALELLRSDRPVGKIAKDAGYGGVESFSRAFTAAYAVPPAVYRRQAAGKAMRHEDVRITVAPSYRLAALEHRGAYQKIDSAFEQLVDWATGVSLLTPHVRKVGVFYDDPQTVPTEDLRSCAGIEVGHGFEPFGPTHIVELIGGPCATVRHVGKTCERGSVWEWFYCDWLPQSGYEPADQPPYEVHLNPPIEQPTTAQAIDIHIPLKFA